MSQMILNGLAQSNQVSGIYNLVAGVTLLSQEKESGISTFNCQDNTNKTITLSGDKWNTGDIAIVRNRLVGVTNTIQSSLGIIGRNGTTEAVALSYGYQGEMKIQLYPDGKWHWVSDTLINDRQPIGFLAIATGVVSQTINPQGNTTVLLVTDTSTKTLTLGGGWLPGDKLEINNTLASSSVNVSGKTFIDASDNSTDTSVTFNVKGRAYLEVQPNGEILILGAA